MQSSLPIIEFIKGLVLKDFTGSLLNCKQGGNINNNKKKINLEKKMNANIKSLSWIADNYKAM